MAWAGTRRLAGSCATALSRGIQHPFRIGFGNSWWFAAIPCNLLLGERATAVQLLREATARGAAE